MRDLKSFQEFLDTQKKKNFESLGHAFLFNIPLYYDFEAEISKIIQTVQGKENTNLDIKQIKGRDFLIDEVRKLETFFSYSSFENFKVAVIENIEDAPHTSLESILKVLEEPPKGSLFILTTSNPYKLPQTIISRVNLIQVHVKEPNSEDILESFKSVYPALIKNLPEESLKEFEDSFHMHETMRREKNYLPIFSYIYSNKKDENALNLTLVFLYYYLQNMLKSASITTPHYRGLLKLITIVEETFNQKKSLSYHHFEYPWYALSLLKL